MKVSVIIPVWNTGEAAKRLILQVLEDYDDLEVIAVDDGSSDDSYRILKEIHDKRLKVVRQKNAGPGAARNAGINISRGEYLLFMDSDDEIRPGHISGLVRAIEKQPEAAMAVTGIHYRKLMRGTAEDVYVAARRARRNRENLADYMLYLLLLDGRMYSVINKIFRGEIVRKNELRFEVGRRFAEDTNFVLAYLQYASGDIIFIPEAKYIYNSGTETSTVSKSVLDWKNWEQSYRDLRRWTKEMDGGGIRTFVLLRLVRVRWRVSHLRSRLAHARCSRSR